VSAYDIISDQLIELRKSRGLTLKQVSEATALTIGHLSDMEHGRGNPSLNILVQLAAFYGVALAFIDPDTGKAAPTVTDADVIRKRMFAEALTARQAGMTEPVVGHLLGIVGDLIGFKVETDGPR
jgi:transcriptional regulator with XRE-family HTH domain